MPFANDLVWIDDVEKRLHRRATDEEETAATELLIPMATAELSGYLNRPILSVDVTEAVTLLGGVDASGPLARAFFNKTPVQAIAVVSSDSTVLDPASYLATSWGLLTRSLSAGTALVVTYTAGLDDTAVLVCKSVVLNRVIRALIKASDDALGAAQVTVEGYSTAYEADEYSERELKSVERWRRRVVR